VLALGGVLAFVVLLVVALRPGLAPDASGAEDKRSAKGSPAVPVRTAKVTRQNLPITVMGIGTVRAAMSVTVRSRVDGQLESVAFQEGQDVRAGQLLAQLDQRTFAAQMQQAEAQKARDEAQLTNAQADLRRYEDLVQKQLVPRQQFDAAQAQVRQLQAAVRSDEAALHEARVQLDFTRITAPISGRVGARLVDPGNIVHAADAGGLVVINQVDPIAVQFSVPEGNFQAINTALNRKGARLAVQAVDRDTHEVLAQGQLALLNNQIDSSTGTVQLKAVFNNPGHKLWPGQSVDARLVLGTRSDALTVPPGAVQRNQTGLFAYVIDAQQKAVVRNITVGDTDENHAQVTKGLNEGERVVIDGQYRLVPGAQVVEASGAPAAKQP
jgi:multidrug efflux system membrane fusion protein